MTFTYIEGTEAVYHDGCEPPKRISHGDFDRVEHVHSLIDLPGFAIAGLTRCDGCGEVLAQMELAA